MKADAAEIGGRFDLPDATVAAAIAVAIATIVTETAPHRVIRLN
jgi:hypothetical protein